MVENTIEYCTLYNIKLFSGMENVAEHINEMQRIHEEYGAIFDHLYRQYQRSTSQLHELNPGDLLYYGGVEWLNISGFLGKIKKGLELHAMCFIFRTAVVFLCKERLRSKRKQLLVSPLKNLLGQCFAFIFVYLFIETRLKGPRYRRNKRNGLKDWFCMSFVKS